MRDIVERLKSSPTNYGEEADLIDEATVEITRLRAENEKLRDAYDTDALTISYNLGYTCGKDIAKDEIEKLRVQLNEQIASSKQLRDFIVQYSQQYGRMREALKPFAYYASQIPEDVSNTASASGTVGDLRAAAAAIRESEAKP